MDIKQARKALDKVINKGRVHLYKPIQIAEILHRDRVERDISLADVDTYRTESRRWRDSICIRFLGRTSSSSARYQDDLFNNNAIPPNALQALGNENRKSKGVVEAYIYGRFWERFSQMSTGLDYCKKHDVKNFELNDFLGLFWNEPGLRRSIDKIYEIVVYSLFSALVDVLGVSVEVRLDKAKLSILEEFKDFAHQVLRLSPKQTKIVLPAKINRVGVTNAADRGLDMWANFGLAIQIKHLSLTEDLAEDIVSSVTSDRIVIVCKESEEKIILSLLGQIGWRSRIQSVITEKDLIDWYEKALRGKFADVLAKKVSNNLLNEIKVEFPATDNIDLAEFFHERRYDNLKDDYWLAG